MKQRRVLMNDLKRRCATTDFTASAWASGVTHPARYVATARRPRPPHHAVRRVSPPRQHFPGICQRIPAQSRVQQGSNFCQRDADFFLSSLSGQAANNAPVSLNHCPGFECFISIHEACRKCCTNMRKDRTQWRRRKG